MRYIGQRLRDSSAEILDSRVVVLEGDVSTLESSVIALEDKYVKATWFETINSGTSGTLTPPTGGTIMLDQWSAGVDCVTSTISGELPTYQSPLTAGGVIVTGTLDSLGNWSLSGTPSPYPVALIYVYKSKLTDFDYTKTLLEEELLPQHNNLEGLNVGDYKHISAAQLVVLGNTSNTNTGDETQTTIKNKLGGASGEVDGYLKGTDWTKFDNKQIAGTYYSPGGTDVAVADGGTGASTLTDHGVLVGSGTDPVTALSVLAAGELFVGVAGADPHALAAGATQNTRGRRCGRSGMDRGNWLRRSGAGNFTDSRDSNIWDATIWDID
jgi:hypothetical protein